MLTDERIAQIEARLAAATPGPWRAVREDKSDVAMGAKPFIILDGANHRCAEIRAFCGGNYDNADFIAHAPEDIRYLMDECERLRGRCGAMESAIKRLRYPKPPTHIPCSMCKHDRPDAPPNGLKCLNLDAKCVPGDYNGFEINEARFAEELGVMA